MIIAVIAVISEVRKILPSKYRNITLTAPNSWYAVAYLLLGAFLAVIGKKYYTKTEAINPEMMPLGSM